MAKADPARTHVVREFAADAPLITCRFHPVGRHLFATGEDRVVTRWDLESKEKDFGKTTLKKHDSWVRGIAFSKDGETVITAGYDDTLIWWPALADNPEPVREVKAHAGWIRTVSVSPDGALLASAGNDRLVKLWNVADGSLVRQFEGHERDVYSTFFHPSGEFLLSGDLKGQVHQWEVATGKKVRTFDGKALNTYNGGQRVDFGGVRGIDLSPDGKHLALAGLHKATNPLGAVSQPLFLRFEWESQKLLRSHVTEGVEGIGWRPIFHPDGFLIGCSGGKSGGQILFWNSDADGSYHEFKVPDTARDFDLHPDGIQIATAHYDRKVRISQMAAKEEEPPKKEEK